MPKSTAENLMRQGKAFTRLGRGLEIAQGAYDLANGAPIPETIGKTAGSLGGAWLGAEGGAIIGASIGSIFPGPGTVIGGFVGSGLGSEAGEFLGGAARSAGSALSKAGGAVASFFGW